MRKKVKIIFVCCIVFVSVCILSLCNSESRTEPGSDNSSSLKSEQLRETALLLAGKNIPEKSKLYQYTKTKYYAYYKKELESGWNKFQKVNLDKTREWWTKYTPKRINDTVLYPFSGPDIINALIFFPDAEIYIMFGLEYPGAIPNAYDLSPEQINAGLVGLRRSLNTIFHVNFFRTEGMAQELGNKSFNGITGLLMFFLALHECEITTIKKIAIDSKSTIVPWQESDEKINWQSPPESMRIPGVEISFKRASKKVQKIRFFTLNVMDWSLEKHSSNFIPYLKKEARFSTVVKSASYLMHSDKFSKIRTAILSWSDYIVQDDSGIPLRFFSSKDWKIGYHGYYDKPISLWPHRAQKDLKEAMKTSSTGTLPFSYGYKYKIGESNLMTAERIK